MIENRKLRKGYLKDVLPDSRNFIHVLDTGDATALMQLTEERRKHAMKALANLAKFMGRYNDWMAIKSNFQLKWSNSDSLDVFQQIMDSKNNYSSMVKAVKNIIEQIPDDYGDILRYAVLTGLRCDESLLSIKLIQSSDLDNYYNKEKGVLEHFKYRDTFIRRTKKIFISIVNPRVMELGKSAHAQEYVSLQTYLKRRDIPIRMKYCRKIYGTYMRMNGIEGEIVDLMCGRIPPSVFVRHYLRPDMDKVFERIRGLLVGLEKELD